ncbi:MAG: hypothetical protein ACR2GG_09750 [Gemmatimonadaceae bacterium]
MTTERTEVTTENRAAPRIELVYDRDCPNVSDCRDALRLALTEFGVQLSWGEWDRNSADTPAAYRGFGSPTVLINGRDMYASAEAVAPEGNSCRIYADDKSGSLSGAPSVRSIVNALGSVAAGGPVTQIDTHADASNQCAC